MKCPSCNKPATGIIHMYFRAGKTGFKNPHIKCKNCETLLQNATDQETGLRKSDLKFYLILLPVVVFGISIPIIAESIFDLSHINSAIITAGEIIYFILMISVIFRITILSYKFEPAPESVPDQPVITNDIKIKKSGWFAFLIYAVIMLSPLIYVGADTAILSSTNQWVLFSGLIVYLFLLLVGAGWLMNKFSFKDEIQATKQEVR